MRRFPLLILLSLHALPIMFAASDKDSALALPRKAAGFDVTDFGAKGDGARLDTDAIQRAIDTCSAAGGGTVLFPKGRYLTGTIYLRSHLTLHLSEGAVLLGSARLEDYAVQRPTYDPPFVLLQDKQTNNYPMRHLFYVNGAEDIAIEGRGAIDGQGDAFFSADMKAARARPTPMLELIGVRHLRLENVTILNAPGWTVHVKNCDDVKIRGLSILNHRHAINSDGLDLDSSANVIVSDCRIIAGDDCIVLKTTRGIDGATRPVENVVVTNCILESSASALKLGTESHADFRHVLFSNCVIRDSRTGLALFAKDGGTMEDVRFANITMTTKPKWGQGFEWPIIVELTQRQAESRLSAIRDVEFSDITVYTRGRIRVSGVPGRPIAGINFHHVNVRVTGYEALKEAKPVRDGGPEPVGVPAAFIFTNVDALEFDDVAITWPENETGQPAPLRHAFYGDRINGFARAHFRATGSEQSAPAVVIENSKNVSP